MSAPTQDELTEDSLSVVSNPAMEFMLTEISPWVDEFCERKDEDEDVSSMVVAETAVSKLEQMGYTIGFGICKRLAQNKKVEAVTNPSSNMDPAQAAQAVEASQLEAVKFVSKEFWMEVFQKRIDKLQTNHRGVFVLKDSDLRWLSRLPSNQEDARVAALQVVAFPCGLVRGALANLGVRPVVVFCDICADGANMAACSFQVKIKTKTKTK